MSSLNSDDYYSSHSDYYNERCFYCYEDDPDYLIKCNEPDCKVWFCNKVYQNDQDNGTCIYNHLKRTNHCYIKLHQVYRNDRAMVCTECGCRNCFILLYTEESELHCRMPCAWENGYDPEELDSLISQNKSVNIPGHSFEVMDDRVRRIHGYRNDYHIELEIYRVKKTYDNVRDYKTIMKGLLEIEKEYEAERQGGDMYRNVMIYPVNGNFNKVYFYGSEYLARIRYRSELKVEVEGVVIRGKYKYLRRDKCFLTLDFPIINRKQVNISVNMTGNVISKQIKALDDFFKGDQDRDLIDSILGINPPSAFNFPRSNNYILPNNRELNPSQKQAIDLALSKQISLIQGPPGTGKTLTTSALINHINRVYIQRNDSRYILVCTHSNVACTLIRKNLILAGVRVIQISAPSKYKEFRGDNDMLHNQVDAELNNDPSYSEIIQERERVRALARENNGNARGQDYLELLQEIENKIEKLKREIEKRKLAEYRIICTTCIFSYNDILKDIIFDHLIIDEATQITEPEAIVCFTHRPKHIVLIGDAKQLGPIVHSLAARKLGLGLSLFERFIDLNYPSSTLIYQYRMHPQILKFPNNIFYDDLIITRVNANERTLNFRYSGFLNRKQLFFNSVQSREDPVFNSYVNRREAMALLYTVSYILNRSETTYKIGIITFYYSQVGYIIHTLRNRIPGFNYLIDNEIISVMSVDSCQGKEYDIVILSSVRASLHGIGFLNAYRRLNVALTRAKRSLIIIGNTNSLGRNRLWDNLLYWYKHRALMMTGNLNRPERVFIYSGRPSPVYLDNKRPYRK